MRTLSSLVLTLLLILSAPSFAETVDATTGARPVPDHVTLTWTADPHTTQTITWRADAGTSGGIAQYAKGPTLSGTVRNARASRTELATDLGTMSLFTVTLAGLQPGTRYAYRVGDGKSWSETLSFSTEPGTSAGLTFLVFGDSQSGIADTPEYGPWHDTVHNAFAANKNARFIVNMGDLVEVGQSLAHWNAWFAAARGVIDVIPDMPIQGNHETYVPGLNGGVKPFYWTAQFPLPQNGPDGLQNQVYSWDYGNVHFVALDSQEEEEGPTYGSILQGQAAWLDRDLSLTKKPWKIVFFHKTPYYLKATRTNEAVKATFVPVLDAHHVDVVFNGHDHGVARTYALNADQFVSRPSQGTIYLVTGRSGNKSYPDLSQKVWDAYFYDPQDQPNYMVVQVTAKTFVVKTVKQDGTLLDTFSIDKEKDTDSDAARAPIPSKTWTRYAAPTLVVFGTVVSPAVYHHGPVLHEGKWFVDLAALAACVGAAVNVNDSGATFSQGGKEVRIPPDLLWTDATVTLVATDALTAMGFVTAFHEATNLLEVSR
ncbi:MAG: metallophosphoesterase family protein [Spirochaetia bacterium]